MTPTIRNLAISGSVAVVLGAGLAVFLLDQPRPVAPALPLLPPSITRPGSGASGNEVASDSEADVATIDFVALVQPFSLTRDSAAYVAASSDAPQMYPLRAGVAFMSQERSRDGKWVIALTADGQAAYLPAADLGPYNPSRQPEAQLPSTVDGPAEVVDTATLLVGGQKLALAGVRGEGDVFANQLQRLITARGPQVRCTPHSPAANAYVCRLPDGMDIARAALLNGAAEPADDADDDYREQAEAARAAHRGIWK